MNDTFSQILKLSDERQQLYFLAGKQQLTVEQHQRLDALNGKLPVLWDIYRRELAADSRETKERLAAQARYPVSEVRRFLAEEDERKAA